MSLKKGKFQHNQSISLWNYTLSPGWREEEVKILKCALQLFGVGKWRKIIESGCLPGKSIGQIYMQTQRLLGQQSLGDFMGLQIDLQAVFNDNMKKQDVLRKNNCIINTGDNPTKEERKRRIEKHRKMYGLSPAQIRELRLPKVKKDAPEYMTLEDIENEKFTNLEILTHLYNLRSEILTRLAAMDASENKQSGYDQFNQNSNASSTSELILTVEQSGRKKFKVLSVEETNTCPLPVSKKIAKNKKKLAAPKRTTRSTKNGKKQVDSESDEITDSENSRSSSQQQEQNSSSAEEDEVFDEEEEEFVSESD